MPSYTHINMVITMGVLILQSHQSLAITTTSNTVLGNTYIYIIYTTTTTTTGTMQR